MSDRQVPVLIVGGLLFTQWAAKPSYTPLFSNLAPTDAAAVTVLVLVDPELAGDAGEGDRDEGKRGDREAAHRLLILRTCRHL